MFSLLAAQGLFLVRNRRYSGEISLLLHNKYRAARLCPHRHSVGAGCDSPFRLECVCVWGSHAKRDYRWEWCLCVLLSVQICVCLYVCVFVDMWAGRTGGLLGEITAQICPLLFTHTLPLRPLKAYPKAYPAHTHEHTTDLRTHTHTHRILISTLSKIPITVFTVFPSPKLLWLIFREMDVERQEKEGWTTSALAQLCPARVIIY